MGISHTGLAIAKTLIPFTDAEALTAYNLEKIEKGNTITAVHKHTHTEEVELAQQVTKEKTLQITTQNPTKKQEKLNSDPTPEEIATAKNAFTGFAKFAIDYKEYGSTNVFTHIDANYDSWSPVVIDLIVNLAKKEAANNSDNKKFYTEISKYLTKFLAKKAYAIKTAQNLGTTLDKVAATTDKEKQFIEINRFIKNSNAEQLNIYQLNIIENHLLSTGVNKETLKRTKEILLSLYTKYLNEYGLYGNGSNSISDATARSDYHLAEKKERLRMSAAESFRKGNFAGQLSGAMRFLIEKLNLPTAEEMADLAATGVTSIDDVPNNPILKEIFAELQITTKMDGKMLGVYINGKYTNFDAFDPEYYQSYSIYPDPANESGLSFAVIFDKLETEAEGGRHYLKKFALESGKVISLSKSPQRTEFIKTKSFELAPKKNKSD